MQPPRTDEDDWALAAALRAGDREAFLQVVRIYHAVLVRTAMAYVRDREVAEEVVQEAWIAVLKGIGRFEGRSSLRTWIFRIVVYQAKGRARRERRSVPLGSLGEFPDEPSVDPSRFRLPGEPWAGHWLHPPASWGEDLSTGVLTQELLGVVRDALRAVPDMQQVVMTLRDIHGWTAAEVSRALQITRGNQRVLLHRARSRVRQALELYLKGP